MKVSELMINDWVNKISPGGIIAPVQATFRELLNMEDPIQRGSYIWQPIPLTDEILRANKLKIGTKFVLPNNGISEWDDPTVIFIEKVSYIVFGNEETVYHVSIRHNETNCFEGGFIHLHLKIPYVHQLQHALRLCGLNGLADNFKIQ